MRVVPATTVEAFYSGNMIGERRNFARVTVQQADMRLFKLPYNTYASWIFGSDHVPRELPNVKSVEWQRGTGQDFAQATITFYNTKPLDLGTVLTRDLDQPGYYTATRGKTQFTVRWGQTINEWSGLIVPDNILRTYEGYGFDQSVIPERDAYLSSTGVWRIDDVDYSTEGLIVVTARDVGSILGDQITFAPIVPKSFWPLTFTADPNDKVGFIGPSVKTKTEDTATITRPAEWTGPTGGPATTTHVDSDGFTTITWTRPSHADTTPDDTHYGYKVVGYQVMLDGIIMPTVYGAARTSCVLGHKHGVHDANVYSVRMIALWKELLTKKGELHFKTNIEHQVRSDPGPEAIIRTHDTGTVPIVTPGSLAINVNETDTLAPNYVRFDFTHPGTYVCIAYKKNRSIPYRKFFVDVTAASGRSHFDTGGVLGDMTEWNFLVYGRNVGSPTGVGVGPGDVYFAGLPQNAAWFGAPDSGKTPDDPPDVKTPKVKRKDANGTKTPLRRIEIKLGYSDSSNTPYVGAGEHVSVYGHTPYDGLHKDGEYWLSIGNDVNTAGYSYEWLEGAAGHATISSVRVHTKGKHYGLYVSIFADGKWVQHSDTGIIPYNPDLPESHNHANIPYAEFQHEGDTEGPVTIYLRKPVAKVTKVRVTFHNLQHFDVGDLHYRAAVRYMTAFGQPGPKGSKSGGGKTVPPIVVKPVHGGANDDESSITKYTPAHIKPGLGANPGLYQDYTDIVKLFCAWAGFFWQNGAYKVLSDGSLEGISWGAGPYGLPNVDPVLGDVDSGRVWGDLEETGTTGIVPLPASAFAMQSLMDGITYIRNIVNFIFYVDEDGAVVWRLPNLFAIGNWIGNDASADTPVRVNDVVVLDEKTVLVDLHAKSSGRNVRERFFISSADGTSSGLAKGYNPNPTGLRRVGGWTDQNFGSDEECQLMADMIALRQLFSYRKNTLTIHGYPAIQVDDQVIIIEQQTSEGYYHYVSSISSKNDLEAGGWTYDMETNWLGDVPFETWAFNPADLSDELQTYIDALTFDLNNKATKLPKGSV